MSEKVNLAGRILAAQVTPDALALIEQLLKNQPDIQIGHVTFKTLWGEVTRRFNEEGKEVCSVPFTLTGPGEQ